MAQSDARFGYTASLSRSDHDLSRPFGFTCAPGMLLPVHADVVSPGDTLYVKHDLPFMRTSPLAAPAMVDIKVHFETFFVPLQMIYQVSENTLTSINEQFSSLFVRTSMQNANFPLFNYSAYVNVLKGTTYQGTDLRAQAFRLADMLDLNAENFCNWHGSARQPWLAYAPSFFPWQILAYHTIFHYYYRLDDKTQIDPTECNWDSYYSSTSPVTPSQTFMRIHQRPWDFDYFTSVYWTPIVSPANMQQVLPYGNYSDLVNVPTSGIRKDGQADSNNSSKVSYSAVVNSVAQNPIQMALSAASIRQLFANEKLAMITGRARKNYDSQILAHYGVHVPHDVKHELTLIGQDTYHMRVGEVTSLASTEDAPLGELAGKGWASSREDGKPARQHKFTAPVHGVVMTIFSVEPVRRYFGGFAKQNAVSDAYDLPVPEFDRLGNQPVFRYQVGDVAAPTTDQASDLVAWKERYYEWKRRAPKCTLAFASGQRGQGVNNYEAYMLATRPFSGNTMYSVRGTAQAVHSNPADESKYYIPFNALDSIMLQRYGYGFANYVESEDEDWDNNPHLVYVRDPFIVDCYPTVKKVSWMSKDGEPIYPY